MNNYIAHHGIKGQKWYVRRFQNEDGTLTAAGKARYAATKVAQGTAKVAKGTYHTVRKTLGKRYMGLLTDEELDARLARSEKMVQIRKNERAAKGKNTTHKVSGAEILANNLKTDISKGISEAAKESVKKLIANKTDHYIAEKNTHYKDGKRLTKEEERANKKHATEVKKNKDQIAKNNMAENILTSENNKLRAEYYNNLWKTDPEKAANPSEKRRKKEERE